MNDKGGDMTQTPSEKKKEATIAKMIVFHSGSPT